MAETPPNPVHAKLVRLLGEHGPIDAVTLSELAEVPYSTTARKLRGWADSGEIIRIKGVGKTPTTFTLLDTTAIDLGEPQHAEAETDVEADVEHQDNTGEPDPAGSQPPVVDTDVEVEADEPGAVQIAPDDTPPPGEPDMPAEPTAPETADVPTVAPDPETEPRPVTEEESEAEPEPEPGGDNDDAPEPAAEPQHEAADKPLRRASGAVRDAALRVLRANPDTEFKVIEVARLVKREFTAAGDLGDVSSGAVVNALNKFAGTGEVLRTVDKPATYRAV